MLKWRLSARAVFAPKWGEGYSSESPVGSAAVSCAEIIWRANGPLEFFALFAGLSIELPLKGTRRAFDVG